MAYPLRYRAPTGKTLKAIIKDLETSLLWDEINSVWVAAVVATCQIPFTESSDKGFYTASGGLTPVKGGMYEIIIVDSDDSDYGAVTVEVYPPKSKTVLEVINAVQTELGMPNSTTITDSLAKKILAKINSVLQVILPGANVFDHMKVDGNFTIDNERTLYRLAPVNVDVVDRIDVLRDVDGIELTEKSYEDFKELALDYAAAETTDAPKYWRIANRDHGYPVVEFTPPPDQVYTIYYTVIKAPKELTAATEYVINPLVVQNGALAMVKQGMGRDASVEAGIFSAALDRASATESHANTGDVEV